MEDNNILNDEAFEQMMKEDELLHGRAYELLWEAIRTFVGERPGDGEYVIVLETMDEIIEEIEQAIDEARARQAQLN